MFINKLIGVAALVLALSGLGGLAVADLAAQEASATAGQPASIRAAIEQHVGKRVKLKLNSGQDLEGKVVEVGAEVVNLVELTGMEFFSATVALDEVAAVISRTPTP